jgi:PAS domain S-box-containing protein
MEKTISLLERISHSFLSLDRNWNITYVNKEAERFVGLSRNDLNGKNFWDAFLAAVNSPIYKNLNLSMER